MILNGWQKQKLLKRRFTLPNELFSLGLISTENTTITTKKGVKRNGSLRYTIRPIKEAVELYHQRQLRQLELDTARWNAEKALKGSPLQTSEAFAVGRGRTA